MVPMESPKGLARKDSSVIKKKKKKKSWDHLKPFLSPEASGFWFSINIEILHFSVWEELKSWGGL